MDKHTWHNMEFFKKEHSNSHCVFYIQDGLNEKSLNTDALLRYTKENIELLREYLPDLLPEDIPVIIVKKEDFLDKFWPKELAQKSEGDGGICIRNFDNEPPYHSALVISSAVTDKIFREYSISTQVNFIHEIAHIMHSLFYNNSVLCEGLAEIIPEYILGFEEKDPSFFKKLSQLKLDQLPDIKELKENGFFTTNNSSRFAQYSPSYQSAYLWMRGLIKRIEKKEKLSKEDALRKTLHLLSKINSKLMPEQMGILGEKIGLSAEELYTTLTLQQESLKEIEKLSKRKNLLVFSKEKIKKVQQKGNQNG